MNQSTFPRVVIVAEHASMRFGGEASLPVHYFSGLRQRGVESWLVVHERTRNELSEIFASEMDRIHFLPDLPINRFCARMGRWLPDRISYFTLGYISRIATQRGAVRIIRQLVQEMDASIIHQPIPVSPRETSLLYDMGVPVIIGPMNGNMHYPPVFQTSGLGERIQRLLTEIGRSLSESMHWIMPGKIRAAMLLISNERTRQGLPSRACGEVRELVENGVDLAVWHAAPLSANDVVRFIFMGRLIDWKAVDIILHALAAMTRSDSTLEIIGDGPMKPALVQLTEKLKISHRVKFSGWLSQKECAARLTSSNALLLPSLYECGGAVVLEAMACARPVVATAWGGPMDYLNPECGFLIPPDSREALVMGFAAAMDRLASDEDLCRHMGAAARSRIEQMFSWEKKIETILEIYRHVLTRSGHSLE